jgi:hypothetical protein
VRWVDGAGRVAGYGDLLEHRDANGHWWLIDWTTGQVDQVTMKGRPVTSAYATADCTGARYYHQRGAIGVSLPIGPPLVPVWVEHVNVWRARVVASQMTVTTIQSLDDSAGCSPLANPVTLTVLRASDTVIATLPILSTSGPLFREVLQ